MSPSIRKCKTQENLGHTQLSFISSTMKPKRGNKLKMGSVKPFIDWGTSTRADFMALNYSSMYLPRDRLRDGFVYLIHAPKNYIGIWNAEIRSFWFLTESLGHVMLVREFHWDCFRGLVKPFVELEGPVTPGTEREVLEAKQKDISHDEFVRRTRKFHKSKPPAYEAITASLLKTIRSRQLPK